MATDAGTHAPPELAAAHAGYACTCEGIAPVLRISWCCRMHVMRDASGYGAAGSNPRGMQPSPSGANPLAISAGAASEAAAAAHAPRPQHTGRFAPASCMRMPGPAAPSVPLDDSAQYIHSTSQHSARQRSVRAAWLMRLSHDICFAAAGVWVCAAAAGGGGLSRRDRRWCCCRSGAMWCPRALASSFPPVRCTPPSTHGVKTRRGGGQRGGWRGDQSQQPGRRTLDCLVSCRSLMARLTASGSTSQWCGLSPRGCCRTATDRVDLMLRPVSVLDVWKHRGLLWGHQLQLGRSDAVNHACHVCVETRCTAVAAGYSSQDADRSTCHCCRVSAAVLVLPVMFPGLNPEMKSQIFCRQWAGSFAELVAGPQLWWLLQGPYQGLSSCSWAHTGWGHS